MVFILLMDSYSSSNFLVVCLFVLCFDALEFDLELCLCIWTRFSDEMIHKSGFVYFIDYYRLSFILSEMNYFPNHDLMNKCMNYYFNKIRNRRRGLLPK